MTLGISWLRERTPEHVDRARVLSDGKQVGEMVCLQTGVLEREYVSYDAAGLELGRSLKMYDALKFFC